MGNRADDTIRTAPGPAAGTAAAPARRPAPFAARPGRFRPRRFRLFRDPRRRVLLRTR